VTSYSEIIAGLTATTDGVRAALPDAWRQGRTAFGGISAALCVEAAGRALPDLPPLRSAQFAFVGPASGDVRAAASELRRGRSTVFASVDLSGEDGLALRATLCFGAARQSAVSWRNLGAPAAPDPDRCPPAFPADLAPVFLQNFDALDAGAAAPDAPRRPERLLWLRHRDPNAPASTAALLALADAPPPAAIILFPRRGPISTMTWMTDMLTEAPATTDGWWLVRAIAETIEDGYSAQTTTIWSRDGTPTMIGRQSVAVFV
jgi:acyl-CoA thioesterase